MIYPPVKLSMMRPTIARLGRMKLIGLLNDGANYPGEGVSGRHYQGGIQAAFDTSVNYVRLVDWYNDVADKNKTACGVIPNSDGGDPQYGHNPQ